jgi:6-pyruvoyl-tetrahydropterin synthase
VEAVLEEKPMPGPSIFLNDFTVLDFAFVSAQSGVSGDSYYVSAELFGELDEKDFLFDFSQAKKALKALVDECFDHKLLVPMGAGVAKLSGSRLEIRPSDGSSWSYECPREAFELFPDKQVDAGVIAYHLSRLAKGCLPRNVAEARFSLSSSPRFSAEASFRYTHGLRFHDGNCQRLFHGHRNPVEVWVNGKREDFWERSLAAEWNEAHFVAVPTLRNRPELDLPLGKRLPRHGGQAIVEYSSAQGGFRASLPASRVILVSQEPSIETMSELAAETLRAKGLKESFRVVAYEGLNKGAATSRSSVS